MQRAAPAYFPNLRHLRDALLSGYQAVEASGRRSRAQALGHPSLSSPRPDPPRAARRGPLPARRSTFDSGSSRSRACIPSRSRPQARTTSRSWFCVGGGAASKRPRRACGSCRPPGGSQRRERPWRDPPPAIRARAQLEPERALLPYTPPARPGLRAGARHRVPTARRRPSLV